MIQQINDFLERRLAGKLINVISAVDQSTHIPAHRAELRLRDYYAFQATFEFCVFRHRNYLSCQCFRLCLRGTTASRVC